jgi:hypothetical protein
MSAGPEQYPLKLTPEQEEAISTMPPMEIPQYLHEIEVAAGLRNRDPWNSEVMRIVEPAEKAAPVAAAAGTSSITVNGITMSGTPDEVSAQLLAYYRAANARGELTTTNDTVARNANGTFAKTKEHELTADEATRLQERARLDMQFRTGQIPVEDYLKATGAFDNYAREVLGIEPDPARREQVQNDAEVKSWAAAAEAFRLGPTGADWPGGEEMQERLGHMIETLGLTEQPSVESIYKCWLAMKAEDATTPEEMRQALGTTDRQNAQILWGRTK